METSQVVPNIDNMMNSMPMPIRKRGRPAPSKCTICYDFLLLFDDENTKEGETPALIPIVTLKCGHLFHTGCINDWFRTKRNQELKNCPFCNHKMRSNDIKRIFPISSGEE